MSRFDEFRELIPREPLTKPELLRIAERQADRLLAAHGITRPPVPTWILRDFPRVRVEYWHRIPVSGSTHWTGHDWIIVLDANEPTVRQRFTLAHEVHHILMHPVRDVAYPHGRRRPCGR